MKHTIILLTALLATAAHATGPKPEPAPPTPVGGTSNVHTEAAAAAAAQAGAQSGAQASTGAVTAGGGAGGNGGQGGAGTATTGPIQVGGDISSSTSRALGLAFPAINFGSASAGDCLAAGPTGVSIGWGFLASSDPKTTEAKVCNLRALAREAASQCQWRTAAHYRAEAARALGVEPAPLPELLVDMDPLQCVAKPAAPAPIVQAAAPAPDQTTVIVQVEQAAPLRAPQGQPKRRPTPPCPDGQQRIAQCVPR